MVKYGLERDPDEIHQKLWNRKKLKIRRERNESKKVRKQFFKTKDELNDNDNVPDKQKQFYADLFKKDEAKPITEKKKKKEKKSDKSEKKEDSV